MANKKNKSDYVIVEDNRVLRVVSKIEDAEAILSAINLQENIKKHIIDTKIFSVSDKLLEHRKIKHIIHSGEFTESMAYDVTRLALDIASYMIDKGIYSYDLLPHNFTLDDGKWILYDFGSFSVDSRKVKTQIRSTFKISFASYELLKLIKRSRMKHYFLNRVRSKCLIHMISFKDWIKWRFEMAYARFLSEIGLYKQMYRYLKEVQMTYDDMHTPLVYKYKPTEYDKEYNTCISKMITSDIEDILCLGKFGGDFALESNISFSKIVYIDDYDLCDKYYNYVKQKRIPKISSAVFQPLLKDKFISDKVKYRALYDEFTCERFRSDTVILDFDEIYDEKQCGINEFLNIISGYSDCSLILKISKNSSYFDDVKSTLPSLYKNISVKDFPVSEVIELKEKISNSYTEGTICYKNANRMNEADAQNLALLDILNV